MAMAEQGLAPAAPIIASHHPLRYDPDSESQGHPCYFGNIVIDPLQDRLYNWLNGPTTLNDLEINALINNLVFIIRSLQKNSKGKNTGLDKLGDDEIYVVTSSANGGFTMSVFFGNNLICVGEYANHRESAMNGLRRRVEKMISSIIESKAKATKNVERKGSEVVLNKVAAEMDAVDDSPASEATAADDQAADSSGNALSPGGISLAVMGEAPLESSQFVPNGTWTPGIIPVSALPPHSLAQLQAPQSVSSSSSGDPHLSDLSDEE